MNENKNQPAKSSAKPSGHTPEKKPVTPVKPATPAKPMAKPGSSPTKPNR